MEIGYIGNGWRVGMEEIKRIDIEIEEL